MKKITLALFGALCLQTTTFGQPTVLLEAPQYDGSYSSASGPNGTNGHVYHRTCWFIPQTELTGFALTNSAVTQVAMELIQGVSSAASGQFTLYLGNTSDVSYSKGTTWGPTMLAGMVPYTGVLTLPVTTGTALTSFIATPGFVYNGQGLYVATEWINNGPYTSTAQPAFYMCNTQISNGGARAFGTSAPTTMTASAFRPAFVFSVANTATNQIEMLSMDAPGKVSKLVGTSHVVSAILQNHSVNSQTAAVTLTVGGVNPFSDTKIVSTPIPAGGTVQVNFNSYAPTTNGISTMTVVLAPDQDNTDNGFIWQQSVTCNEFANNPPVAASAFTMGGPYGYNASGILSTKYVAPAGGAELSGIRFAVSTDTNTPGKTLNGVLLDNTGAIVATSQPLTMTNAMGNTFQTFNFSPPEVLTGGATYYLGVAIPTGPAFPLGALLTPWSAQYYYSSPIAGGSVSKQNLGYFGVEAVLTSSVLNISATASKTLICKGNTVTLTATGSPSVNYVWSVGSNTSAVIQVTPLTVPNGTGVVAYSVNGTHVPTGCKTNAAAVSVSVSACAGLDMVNADAIRVFPNPTESSRTTLTGLIGTNNIAVFNTLGQVVLTKVTSESSAEIDLSSLASGQYLVKITDSSDQSKVIKVVHQR